MTATTTIAVVASLIFYGFGLALSAYMNIGTQIIKFTSERVVASA